MNKSKTSPRAALNAQQVLSSKTDTSQLKRTAVRGGAAVLFSQGFGSALQLGTLLVLARILSPADYGLQAMVLTLTNLVSLLKDAGLNFSTVNRETLTDEEISTLFWINAALGLSLTLIVAGLSFVLVVFYKDPRLFWITIASSSIFFLNGLAVQHRALLDRSLRFTTNATIDTLSAIFGTVVAIVMAAMGCGYWALICQNISLSLFTVVMVWMAIPWLPGRPHWTPETRSMVRAGGTVTLNGIVVYFAYNTEKILLGRAWGPSPLGIYGRAYQLANLPVQQLTNAVSGVAFPVLSRLQSDPPRLRRIYLRSHSLVVSLTVPVVLCCALFSDELVRTLLGPKWIPTAPVLRLLSPAVMVFALMNPMSALVRATGRVERSLKIAFILAPVIILGVALGLRYGPVGVATGYSAAMLLLWIPCVAWAKHGTGVTAGDYLDCIWRPLMAGLVAAAAGWVFRYYCHDLVLPGVLLVMELVVSFGLYALLLLFAMDQWKVYRDLFLQFRASKSDAAVSVS